ncbi:MAG: DUF4258 domain-containing protein [Gemmatimonadaceae bacterium]|nr:DUF4258 domain-containing protein [Chitinophagaceae bacterium]
MKKALPYILLIVLVVAALAIKRCTGESGAATEKKTKTAKVNRNRGFDRRVSYIEYTTHAKCRMECREITQAEVEEIMKEGKINYKKSDVNDAPCPSYALEGYTSGDNQHVRIVFGQCDLKTKVITCIDLDKEFECDCK